MFKKKSKKVAASKLLAFLFVMFFAFSEVHSGTGANYSTDEPLENGSSSGVEVDTGLNSGGNRSTGGGYTLVGSVGNPFYTDTGNNGLGEPLLKTGIQTYDQLAPKHVSGTTVNDRRDLTDGSDYTYTTNTTELFGTWSGVFLDLESGTRYFRYDVSMFPDGSDLPANRMLWKGVTPDGSTFQGSVTGTYTPGTTYYFCVVAVNTAGITSNPVCSNGITPVSYSVTITASKETNNCVYGVADCVYDFGSVNFINSPYDTLLSTYRGATIYVNVVPNSITWDLRLKARNSNFSNGTQNHPVANNFFYKLAQDTTFSPITTSYTTFYSGSGQDTVQVDYRLFVDVFAQGGTNYQNDVDYQLVLMNLN